jgi:NAD(P) transhydrogenase
MSTPHNGAEYDYDMLVIGSGPAGHRAAIQAAKLGKSVAIVERRGVVGGVCLHTGTIPSKTLRQAALRLSDHGEQSAGAGGWGGNGARTMKDLLSRVDQVVRNEIDVARNQLRRNGVEVLCAGASFVDPHRMRLQQTDGSGWREVTARSIVLAVGTVTTLDPHVPFDGQRIFSSDDILTMTTLPRTLAVVGAGVIGLEYASIFAALGVRVTVVDKHPLLLPFVDREVIDTLVHHLRENRATLRLGEAVQEVAPVTDEHGERVRLVLASGKQIVVDRVLYSIGRTGATSRLELSQAGITADERGRISVNREFQTAQPHIYAVGDVIGFPSLASTSMEQGRIAACHALGKAQHTVSTVFPYGIYTVPGISMVGQNEEELTRAGVPYEVGRAQYREIARGQIAGDSTGLLKLVFHRETRKLLGVHIIGLEAAELVHIGQAVMAFDGTIDYFVDTIFNYPTLAECYKTAAFDGVNRLA